MIRVASLLLADHSNQRMAILQELLEDEFIVATTRCGTIDDVQQQLRASACAPQILLISEELAALLSEQAPQERDLEPLSALAHAVHVGVLSSTWQELRFPTGNWTELLEFPAIGPTSEQIRRLCATVAEWLPQHKRQLRAIVLAEEDDFGILEEMIRSLDGPNADFGNGKRLLTRICSRFFRATSAEVGSVALGSSGAKVFRVRPVGETMPASQGVSFALKLAQVQQSWRLREETGRQAAVRTCESPEQRHFPRLIPPSYSDQDWPDGVTELGWSAICYEFLGEPGMVVDLRTVFLMPAADLARRSVTTRTYEVGEKYTASPTLCLGAVLDWLRSAWGCNDRVTRRVPRRLWLCGNPPPRQYPRESPPYRIPINARSGILSFLADPNMVSLGRRLVRAWPAHSEVIWSLASGQNAYTGVSLLDAEETLVLQAPVHGDLNGENILFCLCDPEHPFFIDVPMFQIWGHAMQDFARLEAELIYAVMDRQSDSPIERLPALDLTPAQFPLWCALETHLLAHHCSSPLPSIEGTYPTNVSTVLNLVLQVRQAAQSVQTQKKVEGASPDFLDEYLPALLFQTLKIISYDAISPLKRILAVRSAVAILDLIDTRRLDPSSACVQ